MEFLKQLLGDKYKEGMTVEEINSALEGRKFADLSTGEYVSKGKAEADQKAMQAKLKEAQDKLKNKMTDDEKAESAMQELIKNNEALAGQISAMKKEANKARIESAVADTVSKLKIDTTSETYTNFINSVSTEDAESTKNVASFLNDVLGKIYTKGAEEKQKELTGSTEFKKGAGDGKTESIGTRLGKEVGTNTQVENPYFK